MESRETVSVNNIRTAIRQLSVRAQLANKEGRYPKPLSSKTASRAFGKN